MCLFIVQLQAGAVLSVDEMGRYRGLANPASARMPSTICGMALFVVECLTACRDKKLKAAVAGVVSPRTVIDA